MIQTLLKLTRPYLDRAYAPYSGRSSVAVALLSDGTWIPGVRVENASFPLTLKASVNAVTSALAAGRADVVALLSTEPDDDPLPYVTGVLEGDWWRTDEGLLVRTAEVELPTPRDGADLTVEIGAVGMLESTRELAGRAWAPESAFPVSCLLDLGGGRGIPGVNVEHADWTEGLCAERNALGTWVTLGQPTVRGAHLSCPRDPWGTPCGACRQWLVELVPNVPVHMDRGPAPVEVTLPGDLLPGAFTGRSLRSGSAEA